MSPRLIKYLRLLCHPACWPALAHGVAATLEHDTALSAAGEAKQPLRVSP
jgi:hypothetical protein